MIGLFITGTDTGVGKTYVGALIARALAAGGHRVGVYKPAASGCRVERGRLVADDAVMLWEAAGRPGELERVCPQRFVAPLAPHLTAREEGKELDGELLRRGLEYWRQRSDIVVVEGAGGLMSPLGDAEYVADLAEDFGFPLVVVSKNVLGTINQTLQTLIAAQSRPQPLPVAGVVLNNVAGNGDRHCGADVAYESAPACAAEPVPLSEDLSLASNRRELESRLGGKKTMHRGNVPRNAVADIGAAGKGYRHCGGDVSCSSQSNIAAEPVPFSFWSNVPLLAEVAWQGGFDADVDWARLAR